MGDIIVVRPRSALGRRIECERAAAASDSDDVRASAPEHVADLDHTEIVDLSRVVSKYVSETEKNLRRLFERAERADHVLVFDESDELFGRRDADPADACVRMSTAEFSDLLKRLSID